MAAYARSLRANGVPVPQIAQKLVITAGKNKGQRPSVATGYRILAEDADAQSEPGRPPEASRSTHCPFDPYLGDTPPCGRGRRGERSGPAR